VRVALVLTTLPNAASARRLAAHLIKMKLAACVSFREGWVSTYRWKGRVERAKETLAIIKTTSSKYSRLENEIKALHPYDVPEILCVNAAGGLRTYLQWIAASVS